MKWHELGEMQCPVARSLAILGDRWTLLIIRNAFMRTRRFDDFQ